MNVYVQANEKYIVDYDTKKLIPKSKAVKPFEVQVPFYLWSYKESVEHRVPFTRPISSFTKSNYVNLGMLSINFRQYGSRLQCDIKFPDERVGAWKTLILAVEQRLVANEGPTSTFNCNRVDYQLHSDEGVVSCHTKFGSSFHKIDNLGKKDLYPIVNNEFGFGIPEKQVTVEYQGKRLNGRSMVFICGSWGILLSDDLKLDSLVTFTGMVNGQVGVDKFLYTINPYIVKVMSGLR